MAFWWGGACCGRQRKPEEFGASEMMDVKPNQPEDDGDLSPRRLAELTTALEEAELQQILLSVPIFATLQDQEVAIVARSMVATELRDGDYVYRQGDDASEFFVILDGQVQKVVESGDGSKPGIAISQPLGPGSFFGHNALLSDSQQRSCSMKTIGKTRLRKIGRKDVRGLLGDLSKVLKRNADLWKKYECYFNGTKDAK
eukprot:Tamp_29304.p1 GENE.Tamp_29304~~Tamp_29304.p1  ORF type:complete len:200 (+),score=55.17 Tamp_29304:81-680(+)